LDRRKVGVMLMASAALFALCYAYSLYLWCINVAASGPYWWTWWTLVVPVVSIVTFATFFVGWIGWVMYSAKPSFREKFIRAIEDESRRESL